MSLPLWTDVDRYFSAALLAPDPDLAQTLEANAAAGLPPHDVSPLQGKLLQLLVQIQGARTILEIGTLGGYSTLCMAKVLPRDGRIVTLEADPRHAEVARANLRRAGCADRVDLRVGRALDTLPRLEAERAGPFDLFFIDADKPSNPDYLAWALRLARPGSVIIADNVVRDGHVIDPASTNASVAGVRRFMELLAAEPRVNATAVQTVGVKGYDGFVIGRVTA